MDSGSWFPAYIQHKASQAVSRVLYSMHLLVQNTALSGVTSHNSQLLLAPPSFTVQQLLSATQVADPASHALCTVLTHCNIATVKVAQCGSQPWYFAPPPSTNPGWGK
jgi:hypothetical protein